MNCLVDFEGVIVGEEVNRSIDSRVFKDVCRDLIECPWSSFRLGDW